MCCYIFASAPTCGADVLSSLPRVQLQIIDERADGKSAERMGVSLFGQNGHASDGTGRLYQISGLHVLSGDDPALAASTSDQSDVGRSEWRRTRVTRSTAMVT